MDKGLGKIQEIEKELDELLKKLENINIEKDTKTKEKVILEKEHDLLEDERKKLSKEKENFEYISKNISQCKKQTIIKTLTLLLIAFIILLIIMFKTSSNDLISTIIYSIFTLPASFMLGESGNYYSNKRYLKNFSIEELDIHIEENEENLVLNYKKRNANLDDLIELKNNTVKLEKTIKMLRENMNKIKEIRKKIIENYLKNNTELDNLLNIAYNNLSQEKQKQNIKK
ncbi:MAG: hypothetical protein IKL65_01710 [Bacilli bacterium]|nr:hypothetical protein [Bacilli bacterium]